MNVIDSDADAVSNGRYALVAGRFNQFVTDKLIEGACAGLTRRGVAESHIDCYWAPGAFEIPMLCAKLAAGGRYAAVIALGAVIRGETAHFDYVAGECARGIMQINLESEVPVIFGVLTTDSVKQAMARAGGAAGNKGEDAAVAALEMAGLLGKLP